MKGKFITIEGIDGAGKSTRVEVLKKYMEKKKYKYKFLKGHVIFDGIKEKVIEQFGYIDPMAVFFITMAKFSVVAMEVENYKTEYDYIVLDRYIDTPIAYTAANIAETKRENFLSLVDNLNNLIVLPELTLLIDTPANVAVNRKRGLGYERIELGNQQEENEDRDKQFIMNQSKAYTYYMDIYRKSLGRMKLVSGEQSPNIIVDIFKEVMEKNE